MEDECSDNGEDSPELYQEFLSVHHRPSFSCELVECVFNTKNLGHFIRDVQGQFHTSPWLYPKHKENEAIHAYYQELQMCIPGACRGFTYLKSFLRLILLPRDHNSYHVEQNQKVFYVLVWENLYAPLLHIETEIFLKIVENMSGIHPQSLLLSGYHGREVRYE